jgi:hypothetical protein
MADPISAGIGLLGGIAGNMAASKDRGHAQALLDQAIAAYNNVNVPTNLADLINYQQYQNAGQLTPQQEQTISTGPSQQGAVKADPKMLAAQMQALDAMKGLSQTGMSSTDRARLNQIQQQMATQAEGQKQQVMQNFAQRGEGGSGNELLAQLQAGQNASNQANQQGLQVAGQAQQAAQAALGQYANQAGGLEQQQFGQQSQSAQANDLNTRFNVQAQQAQQARNVAAKNAAQQYNLQNQQNIGNANTNLGNTALNNQRAGEQQTYADQMQKAAGISGANFTGANAYTNLGNAKAGQWVQGAQGIANMIPGLSSMGGGGGSGGGGGNVTESDAGGSGGGWDSGGNLGGDAGGESSGLGAFAAMAAQGGTIGSTYMPHMMAGGYASSGNMNAPYGQYADGGQVPYGGGSSGGGHSGGPQMQSYNPLLGPAAMAHGGGVPCYADGGSLLDPSLTVGPKPQPQQSGGGGMDIASMLPMLAMLAAHGGPVPGKAPVQGDSYTNDRVHVLLSPGEVVIPRSISMHQNAPEMAKLFMENEMRKQGRK